jgi:hypothetical protein
MKNTSKQTWAARQLQEYKRAKKIAVLKKVIGVVLILIAASPFAYAFYQEGELLIALETLGFLVGVCGLALLGLKLFID